MCRRRKEEGGKRVEEKGGIESKGRVRRMRVKKGGKRKEKK